jgi:hypothetical protein
VTGWFDPVDFMATKRHKTPTAGEALKASIEARKTYGSREIHFVTFAAINPAFSDA